MNNCGHQPFGRNDVLKEFRAAPLHTTARRKQSKLALECKLAATDARYVTQQPRI